ncbi:hypothetical protein [Galbibacter sp. PAP.153]|uniref:hypothetical protein n=1 Tax=Galbibacter sp. PAP.153 TaxID=3104623 RepID=UPI003009C7F1
MQLYKSRTFGDYFSDTFSFLKQNGKHFYKNYFIVNGVFILTLLVVVFIFSKLYTSYLTFDSYSTQNGVFSPSFIDNYPILFLLLFLAFFGLILLVGIINYAYTPIYFILYEKHTGCNFTKQEIIKALKANAGKFFIYLLAGLLLAIPVFIFAFIACAVLIVTIIGIPLVLIVLSWLAQFYFIAFIEYLKTDKGVFDCFSYSFSMAFKKFWATNGCVSLFYIIVQAVQTIITMIPYLIAIGAIVVGADSYTDTSQETTAPFVTIITAIYVLSFFLNLFLITVLQMNQGIIYFSLKEDTESINAKSIIDEIGTS